MTESASELKKVKIEVPGPDGANPEVFWGEGATEADAYQAAAAKVAEGKQHATQKIHEQQQQLEELQARLTPAEPPPAANGFDRQAYFNTLYEDPLKAFDLAFTQRFGMSPEDATQQWERMSQVEQIVQARTVAAQFASKHPELLQVTPDQDRANGSMIEKIINENGWAYTEKNLEAAYALALHQGKLKLPAQANAETSPPSPPATLTNNGGSGDNVDEAALLSGMTLDQKRAYYSAKAARLRTGS